VRIVRRADAQALGSGALGVLPRLALTAPVAHLWRQEAQNPNAQEIARRGAELYDKFAAFVGDLEDVGKRLQQSDASDEQAHRKLNAGRGNVVRQAEMLRVLGVKPTKALPGDLLDRAIEERSAADE
jgi:DNA recombination protein RmuC